MSWQNPCRHPHQTQWPLNVSAFTTLAGSISGGSPYGYGLYGYGLYGYGALTASGVSGQVQLGPQIPHTWWSVSSVIIATASVNLSTFYLYRNTISIANLVASSLNGNSDTLAPGTTPLTAGEILIGVWQGGDPGALASMNLTGIIQQTSVASGVA